MLSAGTRLHEQALLQQASDIGELEIARRISRVCTAEVAASG